MIWSGRKACPTGCLPARSRGCLPPPSRPPAMLRPPAAGADLNPLLAFLLTLLTLGLFGVWYAFKVNGQYRALGIRTTDTAGRPLGRIRHPVIVLVLSLITFGFYVCYWV